MKRAIYAFSGDPITYGHMDIIKRAAGVFDEVVVAIGSNPDKKYTFTLDERTDMARRSLASIPNARVVSFRGLLVDYAYENNIPVIVKGVRSSADFDYENVLHQVGASQKLGIDTLILLADPKLAHISSSAAKAIQKEQGLIHEYVPLYVKQRVEERISGQYIIGVTGEPGAGKSFVCEKFREIGEARGIPVHNIELDRIGHQILEDLSEPRYEEVRSEIVRAFGSGVGLSGGGIDRKALGEMVFNDSGRLEELNRIMYTPLLVRLRKELYGKKGLILFNSALIAESDMAYLCNNNAVLVSTDRPSQEKTLAERGLEPGQIARRLASQHSCARKMEKLSRAVESSKQGKVWTIHNPVSASPSDIRKIFDDMTGELGIKTEKQHHA